MVNKIRLYISDNNLLDNNCKIIVGVSGGADSVAMLDILIKLGYRCIAAHCNFHLRDEESNRDELFVKNSCEKYNLVLENIDFDTEQYAAANSISIEMAARDLRYNWFETLRQKHNAAAIAVAHHKDDSAETVLLNLVRGTGIRGMTGIASKNGYVVRPLLCIGRDEVLSYLAKQGLSFVEDSTNHESIFTRNKIRLDVIPLLESINPAAKDAICRTAEHLMQVRNIYDNYIESAKKDILKDDRISIQNLLTYDEPKAILFELLSSYRFNSTVVAEIYESLSGISGKIFFSETHRVLKDREYLIVASKEAESGISTFEVSEGQTQLATPMRLTIEEIKNDGDSVIEKNSDIIYIDKAKVAYPLTIRQWQKGDWFIPFGMKGKKKISDYFSDQKLSIFDKENVWLLCSGTDIVWIVGKRSDNRFRISPETTDIIKITVH